MSGVPMPAMIAKDGSLAGLGIHRKDNFFVVPRAAWPAAEEWLRRNKARFRRFREDWIVQVALRQRSLAAREKELDDLEINVRFILVEDAEKAALFHLFTAG